MEPAQPQNRPTTVHEDEIDLRELIEVLIRGKWIILGITIAAVLAAGIISFFVLTPSYKASTVLLVKTPQIPQQVSQNEPLGGLLDVISKYPAMSLETYRAQVTNPVILRNVIEKLDLDPEKYTVESLAKSVEARVLEKTDLLEISVTGSDPAELKQIADAIAGEFIKFINETSSAQIDKSLRFVEKQIAVEEAKLAEAVREYKEFLAQPHSVQELEREVNSKLTTLTSFKEQLVNNQIEIDSLKQRLKEAQEQLAGTPMTLKTEKSLLADPGLLAMAGAMSQGGIEDLAALQVEDEQLNPLYLKLTDEIATIKLRLAQLNSKQDILREQVAVIGSQLEELQAELAEKQIKDEKLSQKVATLRSNYRSFVDKYEESRISESLKMGETNITVLAPAQEPRVPVGPRKMLNMAVAGVLGVMVSVFLVFFLEFWRKSGSESRASNLER